MQKKLLNSIKYLFFFGLGVLLFWWVYREMDLAELKKNLHQVNYWWLLFSFAIGMLSHISRAYRWNMLIRPLGHQPRVLNTFLSVMVMYLVNLALPRAGEIARCSVLTRYEKVPFTKLVGTVVVERVSDVIALAFFAFLILFSQIGIFNQFLDSNAEVQQKFTAVLSTNNLLLAIGAVILGSSILYIFRSRLAKTKLGIRLGGLTKNFAEGLKTILKMENKWAYIGHTCFIYFMWLLAMYVVFFSYPPTAHLSFIAAAVTFVMGGLAMIAPVQGGIGAYHWMIAHTLVIYGISLQDGAILALIAWATSNLFLMLAGTIAFILLPVINKTQVEQASNTIH